MKSSQTESQCLDGKGMSREDKNKDSKQRSREKDNAWSEKHGGAVKTAQWRDLGRRIHSESHTRTRGRTAGGKSNQE